MELPRYLDGLLDKESVALLSRLPANIKDQVLASVKKVIDRSVSVKANRAVRYALVVAAVDSDIADEVNAGEHECLERVERLFRLHGCDPDHTDDASAAKIYAAGRAARQRIASSLTATEKQYQKSLKLIRRDRDRLPVHVQLALNEQALASVHTHLITFPARRRTQSGSCSSGATRAHPDPFPACPVVVGRTDSHISRQMGRHAHACASLAHFQGRRCVRAQGPGEPSSPRTNNGYTPARHRTAASALTQKYPPPSVIPC